MKQTLRLSVFGACLAVPAMMSAQNSFSFSNQTSLLPTTTFHSGNGVAVVDMNGDKKDDIVRAAGNSTMYIEYQGTPNANFTENSFTNNIGDPWGMCVGDVNNDGYNDVLWGDYGNVFILTRATATTYTGVNVNSATSSPFVFVQGANFADVNNDHYLDGFVCNDVAMPQIYVNGGSSGTWSMNQSLMPLATTPASDNSGNYASIFTDINNDGFMDLMITHCRQGVSNSSDARRIDQVFLNNGNYTYTQDVSNTSGLRDGAQGWSTAWGDIDNDGDLDAFVLNYDVNSKMMINNGAGVFTNIMSTSGINNTTSFFGMNATFQDFDNDGFVDLMLSGDHHYLYKNNGNSTFTLQTNPFVYSSNTITSHAVGDLNGDGKLDLYASYCDVYNSANNSRNDRLWMNTTNTTNHYIMFDLVGGATNGYSNLNGVGAIVKIYGPWGVQVREVRSGEAYGTQNTMACHFGLGQNTSIDSVVVRWPSGIVDQLMTLPADAHYTINEGGNPLSTTVKPAEKVEAAVYPNPMNADGGAIRLRNFEKYGLDNLSVNVYDLNGKSVYSEASLNGSIIPLTGLTTSGMYFFDITTKDGERVASGKFTVSK